MLDLDSLCKDIASRDESIQAVAILEGHLVIASFVRERLVALPKEERLSLMVVQISLMASMIKTNQDYFGRFGHFLIHSEELDTIIFPFRSGREEKSDRLLAIMLKEPYDYRKIVSLFAAQPYIQSIK